MGEKQPVQQVILGKLDSYMKKNQIRQLPQTYTNINSKWIKDINIRSETKKLLEEHIDGTLFDAGLNNRFLDMSSGKGRASLVAQTVKRMPTMWETWVRSLGWEDPLEKEMAPHFSTLAWNIPWTEEPGRLQSMGL